MRALALALLLVSPRLQAACLEGAEGPSTAWTMSGLWHVADANTVSCAGAHSGSHAFYFGIDGQCNYDNGQLKDGSLSSPSFTVTGVGDTNFSFWTKWQVESMSPSCYDQLWVERFDSGSGSWLHFADVGPVSDPPSSGPNTGVASVTGLGGVPGWQFVQLDLSAFAPSTMRLRFRFVSSACMASGCAGKTCGAPDSDFDSFLGWVIDDISLGCPPGPISLAKSASSTFASHGDTLTYVLSAKNWDGAAQTLSVWDSLPAGADFVSAAPAATFNAGLISWSLPGVASMASQAMTVAVSVDPSVPYPTDWLNSAWGSSSAGGALFQSLTVPVKIRSQGVTISKSARPSSLTSGDQVTFTIAVGNFTAATIAQVDITETYPVGFVELGSFPGYASFRSWKALRLLSGETRYYTVWGFANGFNGQTITNRVEAFVGGASQGAATASVSLVRPEVPQLSIRTVYPNPAPSGKPGLPQSAFIVYESNQSMDLTLSVYNVVGEKVRTIPFHCVRGEGQVEWDLKNDYGNMVASGIYEGRLWENEVQVGLIEAWAHIAVLQ